MNYTKGKWTVSGNSIVARQGGYVIELAKLTPFHQGESEANAHLIASSPRMIEFIQKLAREGNKEASDFIQTLDLS